MKCPVCKIVLSKRLTHSHYKVPIILDQCSQCGGIWFDKNELYEIHKNEINNIKNIDLNKIGKEPYVKQIMLCPKDNSTLQKFLDLNFPKELDIERCSICSGFWFNQNQFNKYRNIKNIKDSKNKKKEDLVDNLLKTHANKDFYISLNNLGDFLSMRINRGTMYPESWGTPIPEIAEGSNKYVDETKNTYFMTYYTLKILINIFGALIKK